MTALRVEGLPPLLAAHRGPLVGRDAHLRVLDAAWLRARTGAAELVLLTGPAGSGKTRLARELAVRVLQDGGTVLGGRCEQDAEPLQPWTEALEEAGEGADPLAVLADGRPRLLVLDDLHRADPASLHRLRVVLRRCAAAPLLVAATLRDDEQPAPVAAALAELRRDRDLERVALGPLSVEDVAALVEDAGLRARTGSAPLTLARRLHRRSGGHPLLTAELVRHLRDGGSEQDLPAGTRDLVAGRLARLDPAAVAVLQAAAVLGERSWPDVLARVAERAEPEVLAAVDAAAEVGLLEDERGTGALRFRHALVRDAVHEAVPPGRRRLLHARAARVLEAAGAPAAVLAVHARAGGSDREAAVGWTLQAAQEAARARAAEAAADHLRAALALLEGPGDAARRAAVLVTLGDLAFSSGVRYADGVGHLQEAVPLLERLGDEAGAARARWRLGRALSTYFDEMDLPVALGHLTGAVAVLRRTDDPRELGAALAAESGARYWSGELRRALAFAEEAEALAPAGGRSARAVAQALRGRVLCHLGRLDEGTALLEAAWRAAAEQGLAGAGYAATVYAHLVARRRGDLATAEQVLRRGLALEGLDRTPRAEEQLHLLLASTLLARGDTAAVRALLPRTGLNRDAVLGHELPLVEGDWEAARTAAEALLARRGSRRHQHPVVLPLLLEHQPVLVEALEQEVRTAAEDVLVVCGDRLALALGRLAAGQPDEARRHAEAVRSALVPGQDWGALPDLLGLVDAGLALAAGDRTRALALADAARTALAARGALWLEAEALLAGARADGAAGARARVDAARSLYARAQAGARWHARAEAVLGGHGPSAVFRRVGDAWEVGLAGPPVLVRDSKGMRALALLLAAPHRDVPARELEAALLGAALPAGDAGPVLDDEARAAYRRRLAALDEEGEAADAAGDAERGERVERERAALLDELRRATGLGGRSRRSGAADERARLNVTRALRAALRRVHLLAPDVGAHLEAAVRTGGTCAYGPAQPVRWQLR